MLLMMRSLSLTYGLFIDTGSGACAGGAAGAGVVSCGGGDGGDCGGDGGGGV